MKTSTLSIMKHLAIRRPDSWAIQCEEYLFGVLRYDSPPTAYPRNQKIPPAASATRRWATRDPIFLTSTLLLAGQEIPSALRPSNHDSCHCIHL